MNFGPDHYVPVLKVKRGEKNALKMLSPGLYSRITPLLEIVERRRKEEKMPTLEAHLKNAFTKLAESVRHFNRCFLDTRELAPDGSAAAEDVFQRAKGLGMVFTPVTGVSRSVDVLAALKFRSHGLAVRLTRAELERGRLEKDLLAFMAKHGLRPNEVDLIIDLGSVEDLVVDGVVALAEAFLQEVPQHEQWRTMTLSGSAFPSSMERVERNAHGLVERSEWAAWREVLYERRNRLPRLPTFSDCGIQHPQGVEGFDPKTMQVSAAVRYTLMNEWLLIKGESTRSKPPSEQFPGLGTRLAYGHLRQHYTSAEHCRGCRAIRDAADGAEGYGAPETWRRIGTIHHIETVTNSLASLPWP